MRFCKPRDVISVRIVCIAIKIAVCEAIANSAALSRQKVVSLAPVPKGFGDDKLRVIVLHYTRKRLELAAANNGSPGTL